MDGSSFAAALPFTALAVVVLLAVTFAVAVRVNKHAVIDVVWGLGFVVITAVAFSFHTAGDVRSNVLLVAVGLWGVRLAAHIGARSRGKGEDPRYQDILDRATGNPHAHMAKRVYTSQGLLMWFISLPVQVAMFGSGDLGWLLWLGLAVFAVGLFFEAVGDWQLTAFRNDPNSSGKVLDTGLWRYTRHPNYFGDATAWWGLFLISLDATWWVAATVLSPIVMTWLLAKGSGKPLLEKDMASRRPDYAAYVEQTSGFIPWPPKRRS